MKVVIIEDEDSAALRLKKQLQEIDPNLIIVSVIESVEEAVKWFTINPQPDLIFADIQLADGISFSIFEKTNLSCPVIFITAYDNYAIKAFKLNSIDYLLKPLKKNELENSLEKYKRLTGPAPELKDISSMIKQISSGNQVYQKRMLVRYAQTIQIVELKDAAFFYSEEKVTFLKQKDGKEYSVDHTLDELEELLEPSAFFRVNRQFIVNIGSIKKMEAYSKSRVKLFLEPHEPFEIIVSSEKSPLFKEWLLGK